jgi:DNA-binding transcriptional LysR family regulator
MDLWQLNIFCKVVELKSFSEAGKAVFLSQPTISSHIKDLEDHFGYRLIDRLAKAAVPTKAGEILYRYASHLIHLRDEMETALAEFHGKIKGRLMIGGSTIPGVYILPRMIGAFMEQYPEVTVSILNGDTDEIIDSIYSGRIEIGIVGAVTRNKSIQQQILIEDELRLVIPADHKWTGRTSVTIQDLIKEPFISRETGSGTLRTIQKSFKKQGINFGDLNIVAEMGSTEAVIQGIKGNIGVSIISPVSVTQDLTANAVEALTIADLDLKRNFYLSFHKYRSQSPLGRTFMEFLMLSCNGKFLGLPEDMIRC